jgi:hypothetical protein
MTGALFACFRKVTPPRVYPPHAGRLLPMRILRPCGQWSVPWSRKPRRTAIEQHAVGAVGSQICQTCRAVTRFGDSMTSAFEQHSNQDANVGIVINNQNVWHQGVSPFWMVNFVLPPPPKLLFAYRQSQGGGGW